MHNHRYGQDQWAGTACKVFRRAIPGGAPAAWVTSGSCALKWHKPVLRANVLFLFLAPAVAALAAIALMGLREHPAAAAGSGSSSSTGWVTWWLWVSAAHHASGAGSRVHAVGQPAGEEAQPCQVPGSTCCCCCWRCCVRPGCSKCGCSQQQQQQQQCWAPG